MSDKTNPFGIVSEDTFSDKFDGLIDAVSNAATAYQNKMMYTTDSEGKSVLMQGTEDVTDDVKALLSPDLSIYAEKESVESSLSELSTEIGAKLEGKADKGSSYTKYESDNQISQITSALSLKANTTDIESNYYTKTEVYPISSVYNKEEIDNLSDRLEGKIDSISELSIVVIDSVPDDISTVVTEERVLYLIPANITDESSVYDEYLLIGGVPERVGTTAIDLTNYVTFDHLTNNYYSKAQADDKFLVSDDLLPMGTIVEDNRERIEYIENNPLYVHNIVLKYSHPAAKLASKGSDGRALVSMTIINRDKDSYSFAHNTISMDTDDAKNIPKVMKEEDAWQLLRLYRAIQISTHKDTTDKRSISGMIMSVKEDGDTYSVIRAVADSACSGYQNSVDDAYAAWVRMLTLRGSSTEQWDAASSNIGMITLSIPCGHPTFHTETKKEVIENDFNSFVDLEYNVKDSSLNYYSTYFCQNRIECEDVVVKLTW